MCSLAFSSYDSGFIQFQQPNGTTFIGREYGDEFIFYRETEAGYRYVLSVNGWYYYCSQNSQGDLTATSSKVAIDSPPSVSYHAQYAGQKLAEIQLRRAEFENQVQVNGEWFNQTQQLFRAIHQPTTLNVGVILVEFTDVKHRRTTERPLGYLSADFDSMLFSQHFWYAPKESIQYTSPHPEGHYLYGSMRDYYWDMSRPNGDSSALILTGTLINHEWPDTSGVPIWIELDSTRAYYDVILPPSDTTIFNEAIQKAITQGWLPQEWWLTYQKLIVIYADQILFGGGLNPRANSRNGRLALLGGRYNIGFFQPKFFTHIGFYAHEFGHLIGFHDEYCAENSSCAGTDPGTFEIMARGYANGPFPAIGSCPSSMSPYYKIKNAWAQELLISNDTTGFKVNYDYSHPPYYRMNPLVPGSPNECFVFETRLRRGTFDLYTPTRELADSNRQSGSLLIWRHDSGFDRLMLVHARNGSPLGDTLYTYFPGDRSINRQSFNDESTPAPFLYDGTLAHFALNGIHRDQQTNLTLIDTVRTIAGAGLISRDTTWSGNLTINSDVNVVLGAKLTINPGTIVNIGQGSRRFAINAAPNSSIEAKGTPSQPITFRSSSGQPNTWLGLKALGTGKLHIENSRVRYALDGISIGSSVDSVVSVELDSGNTGIAVTAGHPLIRNCAFRNLSVAADLSTSDVATISNCTFENAELGVRCSRSSPRIVSNHFQYGKNQIEMYDGGSPFVANNLFIGRDDGNGTAIHMPADDAIRPVIVNNTIAKFNYGCLADPESNGAIAHPSIRNNIFYLNWLSSSPEGGTIQGAGSLTYCNIYNRDTATYTPPPTNIERDPMFLDPANGNFALRHFSPSIDAGDPADDFNLEPEPNGARINQGHQGNTPLATRSFNIVASGSISENVEWQGNILVESNLTVEEPATLTVSPGSSVWVAPNTGIDVLGTLNAIGHVPEPPLDSIKFKAEVPGQSWSGIALRKQVDGSTLRYCSISGASTGITIEASAPTIERCLIDNCSTGLDVYTIDAHAQPVINDNEISNCKYGVIFHQAFPLEVRRNRVHDNDIGIYTFQSSPVFHNNVIENNRSVGVYAEASDPRFGDNVADDRGCNIIRNNLSHGGIADLYVSGGGAFLGYYDGNQFFGGFNSVYSTQEGHHCIVGADNNAFVMAHLTWWGISPPPEWLFCLSDAKLDYSKPLDGEPVECTKTFTDLTLPPDNEEAILQSALIDRGRRNYATALNTYATFVAGRPSSIYVRRALKELRQAYREYRVWSNDTTRQLQLLNSLSTFASNHPNQQLRKLAQVLWAEELHTRRNWNGAASKFQQIIQSQPNTVNERVAWYSLFSLAAYGVRDTASARNVLATLQTKYPDDPHTEIAKIRFAGLTRSQLSPLNKSHSSGEPATASLPTSFALEQNYPNPFNPTTTIKYQLPQDVHVVLRVYDILGREVTTLVDAQEEAGFHSIQFQATVLASGVYFYRLQAGHFTDTKKFMLLR